MGSPVTNARQRSGPCFMCLFRVYFADPERERRRGRSGRCRITRVEMMQRAFDFIRGFET
eukprot:529466-Pyramimonas_sp.AAC.1